ncbi:hypothetical protein ACSNN6_30095, partial [Brevibacillus formosus]
GDQAGLHKLRVTEIQAFPTAMRVVLQADMKDGYKLIALTNGRLVDEQGKQYAQIRSNASLKQEGNTSTYYLEVIPSLYFGQQPKKLNLQFDGIRTATVKRGSFTLKLNGKDPLEVPIGDKKLRILRSYYENGKLVLVHPDEPLMAEMALGIDGQQMPQEYDSATGTFKSYISVAKKDEYQIGMKRTSEEASKFAGSVPILDVK